MPGYRFYRYSAGLEDMAGLFKQKIIMEEK